jgi:hypothetical protein
VEFVRESEWNNVPKFPLRFPYEAAVRFLVTASRRASDAAASTPGIFTMINLFLKNDITFDYCEIMPAARNAYLIEHNRLLMTLDYNLAIMHPRLELPL